MFASFRGIFVGFTYCRIFSFLAGVMLKDALFSVAVPVEPPMTVFTRGILYFGFSVRMPAAWQRRFVLNKNKASMFEKLDAA